MTEHKGYSKQWVSGPLRATIHVAGPTGDAFGGWTLCLYHDNGSSDGEHGRPCWVDFELFEVTGLGEGTDRKFTVPLYTQRGSTFTPNNVTDLASAQVTAEGFVKWDGCTQFEVEAVHIDNAYSLDSWLAAIRLARRECARMMPGSDVWQEYPELEQQP